ncbi:hypothetical protein BIW11_11208, partial [Tropilaelaps mercedesae]
MAQPMIISMMGPAVHSPPAMLSTPPQVMVLNQPASPPPPQPQQPVILSIMG